MKRPLLLRSLQEALEDRAGSLNRLQVDLEALLGIDAGDLGPACRFSVAHEIFRIGNTRRQVGVLRRRALSFLWLELSDFLGNNLSELVQGIVDRELNDGTSP